MEQKNNIEKVTWVPDSWNPIFDEDFNMSTEPQKKLLGNRYFSTAILGGGDTIFTLDLNPVIRRLNKKTEH